jgi:hypothetical protein
MGLFSFVETFFFVSLGITFILILLLIYHFRQRFVALEQKCDTMFDLINNIVTELNSERRALNGFGETDPHIMFYPEANDRLTSGGQSGMVKEFHNVNDDESGSDDDESGSDDDESGSDDDESGNEDESGSDEDESGDDAENSVKVITLEPLEELHEMPIDDIDTSDNDENETGVSLVASDPIVVEKLDNEHLENLSKPDVTERVSSDVYNKMSIQALKALVITKGLSSDPSKMKKGDLVKLLETAGQ